MLLDPVLPLSVLLLSTKEMPRIAVHWDGSEPDALVAAMVTAMVQTGPDRAALPMDQGKFFAVVPALRKFVLRMSRSRTD